VDLLHKSVMTECWHEWIARHQCCRFQLVPEIFQKIADEYSGFVRGCDGAFIVSAAQIIGQRRGLAVKDAGRVLQNRNQIRTQMLCPTR
jgi:hypothetical protein